MNAAYIGETFGTKYELLVKIGGVIYWSYSLDGKTIYETTGLGDWEVVVPTEAPTAIPITAQPTIYTVVPTTAQPTVWPSTYSDSTTNSNNNNNNIVGDMNGTEFSVVIVVPIIILIVACVLYYFRRDIIYCYSDSHSESKDSLQGLSPQLTSDGYRLSNEIKSNTSKLSADDIRAARKLIDNS